MLLTSTYSLCETLVENKEQIHARVTFTFWAQSWKGICSLDGRVLTPWFQRRVQQGPETSHESCGARRNKMELRSLFSPSRVISHDFTSNGKPVSWVGRRLVKN